MKRSGRIAAVAIATAASLGLMAGTAFAGQNSQGQNCNNQGQNHNSQGQNQQ